MATPSGESVNDKPNPRIGLALGGGGAKGIAHIAFLKILDELGLRPGIIAGTSMGALIGALYAFGHSGKEIERIFTDLKLVDFINLTDLTLGAKYGLIRGDKIIKTLEKLVQKKSFEDLKIPLKVIATDFWSREEVILDHGSLTEAVRASISIPGIFEAVVTGGRVLIDGGVVNSLPYEILRGDCDLLIAINVLGEIAPGTGRVAKPTLPEAILNTFQIMEIAGLARKLERSRPDIYLSPKLLNIQILDFHKVRPILASVTDDAARFREQMGKFLAGGSAG
ncbi:MAG: patatin-like phospholipase family protein [candidate division FCPU426 bacterium]